MEYYPLQFEPLFRQYIWGGRRLGETLGKSIGPDGIYAESWEIVDHGGDQSVVANGPLAGKELHDLLVDDPAGMLGNQDGHSAFPLLMKYLDCNRVLSVQVHPNDDQAARLTPPDRGKTEAWYVIDAEPDAVIYAGLREGVSQQDLAAALQSERAEDCLHQVRAEPGMCLFIPAGTVHALGAGMLVAEIQQSSDTTYRLYDWGRVDQNGNPRPLHLEAAMEVIDFERGPIRPSRPKAVAGELGERLVECEKFILHRFRGGRLSLGGDNRFHIATMVQGNGRRMGHESIPQDWKRGETILIPAAAEPLQIDLYDDATLLEIHLPAAGEVRSSG